MDEIEYILARLAGGYSRQLLVVDGFPREQLPAALDAIAEQAALLDLAVGRARGSSRSVYPELAAELRGSADGSIADARTAASAETTLSLAFDDERFRGLNFVEREALIRRGVVFLIDSIDLLPNAVLAKLMRLVKKATQRDAPLLVIGSAPRFGPFAGRAYGIDGDASMMLHRAGLDAVTS